MMEKIRDLSAFRARDFCVTDGVALGECLSMPGGVVLDDVYQLSHRSQPIPLRHNTATDAISDHLGRDLTAAGRMALLAPDGSVQNVIILSAPDGQPADAGYLYPIDGFLPGRPYRLISVDIGCARQDMSRALLAAFGPDVPIRMGDGQTKPAGLLRQGDHIMTRKSGPQPITWIDRTHCRARDAYAPVEIGPGAAGNDDKLILRPDHRLFLRRAPRGFGAKTGQVLAKARQLVNGTTIRQRQTGFVDYVQLQLATPCDISAASLWVESHVVDPRAWHNTVAPAPDALPRMATLSGQGASPTKVPSKIATPSGPVTSPNITPAVASALRP
ncbi:Hint domain-containing protein [Yoonia sp. SS1-5]|uniref:Hint domain-containing protein n=1 Tax=Yoonia rhodophyticola TaxID=3137370 RepID=A0AAN0M6T8_9RHOB